MEIADRVKDVSASLTLAITSKAKQMSKEGIDVVSFGAGEPDFDTPQHIKEAAIRAIQDGFTKYTPASGIPELKEAIVKKIKMELDVEYSTSQIVISCGAKHSLYNLFQVICQKGDEVIIPSPYWVSYPEMVRLSGATPIIVPTSRENQFKLTSLELKKVISKRTKALVINSPSNPTGSVYSKEELFLICEIAVENNIYIVSDEIYDKILYDGVSYCSVGAFGEKIRSQSIIINGVSKTYSMTGWRIGYMIAPQQIAEAASRLQSHSTSNPTSISQKAALAAITGKQDFISFMVGEFEKRRNLALDRLRKIRGFSPFEPKGAFYIFCEIPKLGLSSVEFAKRLLEEAKVAVVPGAAFGWDNYIRISFATSMERLEAGLHRIEKWAGALVF